jgi:hypothetical protein
MTIHTQTRNRTEHLLALMTKGDDLFNARDWQALDDVHHRAIANGSIKSLPSPPVCSHVVGHAPGDAFVGHSSGGFDILSRPVLPPSWCGIWGIWLRLCPSRGGQGPQRAEDRQMRANRNVSCGRVTGFWIDVVGGTVVRRADQQEDPPRCPPIGSNSNVTSVTGPSFGTTVAAPTCGTSQPRRSSTPSLQISSQRICDSAH